MDGVEAGRIDKNNVEHSSYGILPKGEEEGEEQGRDRRKRQEEEETMPNF